MTQGFLFSVGKPDGTAPVGQKACDGLFDPPGGIGTEPDVLTA